MKLIEAMKLVKELQKKKEDLISKIRAHCADFDFESPVYPEQAAQVKKWLQAHSDCGKEVLRLRVAIQRTNLATEVPITLGGVEVRKTIAEWIHRRRDLAKEDENAWSALTDRNLKDGQLPSSTPGGPPRDVKVRRYFSPLERDAKIDLFRTEPGVIDRTLEVINAITDLVE